ncbi:MAG: DEAD/DEAH box helicase, partial [Bacteroidota bacterium]
IENVEVLLNDDHRFLNVSMRDQAGTVVQSFDQEAAFLSWLNTVPLSQLHQFSHDLKSTWLTYQFTVKLLEQAAYVPQLLQWSDRAYKVRWLPALLNPVVASLFSGLRSIVATDLLFYKKGKDLYEPTEEEQTLSLVSFFLGALLRQYHQLQQRFGEKEIVHLFFNGALVGFEGYEAGAYPESIQLWLNKFYIAEKDYVPLIQVDEDIDGEGFWVNIAVQKRNKRLSVPIQLEDILVQKKYASLRLDILRDLAMLSEYFPQISELVANKGEESLFFDANAFVEVLFSILPTIRLFGIKVLLPKALRKLMRPQLSMQVSSEEESGTVAQSGLLQLSEMLAFQWRIALGDKQVSFTEFKQLVQQYSGIVKLNDEYVFFDENEIKTLLAKLDNPPVVNQKKLLQIVLTEDYEGAKVKLDKPAQQLMKQLLSTDAIAPPAGLRAQLRTYQQRGYEWLYKNSRIGFGSLIADDMGLGKTLQVISLLLKLKEDGELQKSKAIVIVPTTLLTNWDKEIKKFAPDLKAHIYHGSNRKIEPLKEADVLLTSYGVARSETALLQKQKWLILAIDEAQNIKNPATAQTKAIKKIKAKIKIAMSGTPVENRLSEYWSIFDFANKAYLDTLKKFKEEFAKPIEVDRDREKLERFRKITTPFILRRLKSDKSIIKDLPDKIEQDQFCYLTPTQTALYKSVVDTTMATIKKSEGSNQL